MQNLTGVVVVSSLMLAAILGLTQQDRAATDREPSRLAVAAGRQLPETEVRIQMLAGEDRPADRIVGHRQLRPRIPHTDLHRAVTLGQSLEHPQKRTARTTQPVDRRRVKRASHIDPVERNQRRPGTYLYFITEKPSTSTPVEESGFVTRTSQTRVPLGPPLPALSITVMDEPMIFVTVTEGEGPCPFSNVTKAPGMNPEPERVTGKLDTPAFI